MKRLFGRLIALFRRRRVEEDLDREVTAHLALLEDAFKARGMTEAEARVAARRALGGVDQTKERHRDARSFTWLEDLRRDVPYALRGLRRTPGFTAAAIVTLALGIGATTAVFSVVNAILLQPLPYKDADQLVRLVENRPAPTAGAAPIRAFSLPRQELADWRRQTTTLSEMVSFVAPPMTLMRTADGTARLTGAIVSPNLLAAFGARPVLGRLFDERADGSAIVISAKAWSRLFQSKPDIIGHRVSLTTLSPSVGLLDGRAFEIIGVTPEGFDYPPIGVDFWAAEPAIATPQQARTSVSVVARLADGVSIEAAIDEANAIGNGIRPRPTEGPLAAPLPAGTRRFDLVRMKDNLVAPARPALRILSVAVTVVLLIVCANVANLLLARGTARQRDIAVRLAIGAGRGRIVRQVLTESLVLALIGGILGAAIAAAGVQSIVALGTFDAPGVFRLTMGAEMLPRLSEISLDAVTLLIAVGLSAATAMVFGIAPAWSLSRVGHLPATGHRSSGGSGGTSRTQARLRGGLVICQLVLATTLLVGAGLLVNSFIKLTRVDPGYQADRVLTFYLVTPDSYPTARKAAVVEELLTRLPQLPGVTASGFSYAGPILGVSDVWGTFVPPGRTREEMQDHPDRPILRSISFDYFRTMGTRIVDGRAFTERDGATAPLAVIVNQTAARRLFGDGSPVGQMVRTDGRDDQPAQIIVGVVEDMRTAGIGEEPRPQVFVDYRQLLAMTAARQMPPPQQERLAFGFQSFAVRTDGDPSTLMSSVRSLVGQVDPLLGIDAIAPMSALVSSSITRQRFYTTLLAIFAGIAMILAAVGIYGVLAYTVLQQTAEIGVRMALGAQGGQVMRHVLARGMLLTAVGISTGIAAAAALSRYLASMLYGVTPLDPTTYLAVGTLFGLVALLAAYLPARRATKVDPMVALRCE